MVSKNVRFLLGHPVHYVRREKTGEAMRLNLLAGNLYEAFLDYTLNTFLVFERQKPKACITAKCERSNNNDQLEHVTDSVSAHSHRPIYTSVISLVAN